MMTHSPETDADELVALLDRLCEAGSQHIDLEIGEETLVKTVNSTECSGRTGPCAVPNLSDTDEEMLQ